MMTAAWKLYTRVALGIGGLVLGVFAVVSPFLAHPYDDWWTLYFIRYIFRSQYFQYELLNRQYQVWNMVLAYGIVPERFQNTFYSLLITVWLLGLACFHLGRRLFPTHSYLAYLYSVLFLLWIPYNIQYVMSWLSGYVWTMLLCVTSVIVMLEAWERQRLQRWLWGVMAAALTYMTIRTNEGFLTLLASVPLALFYLKRPFKRADWGLLALWGMGWIIGTLQFLAILLSTTSDDSSYQASKSEGVSSLNPMVLAGRALELHRVAFDPRHIFDLNPHYTLPALALALLFLVGNRLIQQATPLRWPTPRQTIAMGMVGLGLSLLGSGGYIYVNWVHHYRSQMLPQFGQALVVLSALIMLGYGMQRLSGWPLGRILSFLMAGYVFLAAHWFMAAQHQLQAQQPFDQKSAFWQQLLALMPAIEDETLLLLMPSCTEGQNPIFNAATITHINPQAPDQPYATGRYAAGAGYLYQAQNPYTGLDGHVIQSIHIKDQPFDTSGLAYQGVWVWGGVDGRHFGYDQMIALDCVGDRVTILREFPEGYAPHQANTEDYNPYARLHDAFIPEERWRVVVR